jgi:predicted TIM-barrel fold metal-dependent hydrolase
MNAPAQLNRRQLLKGAIATTAAGGLARSTSATETASSATAIDALIDTHIYIGRWPHARLPNDELQALLTAVRHNQVSQAWIGSLDGLFHKDIGAVNQRLADCCAQQEGRLLIPFGTVNPTLPDWEEDIRRCHEQFHMLGIRIHPNYHGYVLDDPRFVRLLDIAAGREVIIQLVAGLDQARHKWLTPAAAQVDLKPLVRVISKRPKLRLVIAGGSKADDAAIRNLLSLRQVYCDFAHVAARHSLTTFVDGASTMRIIFGSGAPLHSIESARAKLQNAKLNDERRSAIASQTAASLIGSLPKPG